MRGRDRRAVRRLSRRLSSAACQSCSSSASRSAIRVPAPVLLDPCPAGRAQRRARAGRVGEQAGQPVGHRGRVAAVAPRTPVTPSRTASGRAAGVAGHHRQAGGRRLQVDHAEPLDVHAQPRGSGTASRTRRRPRSAPAARAYGTPPVKHHVLARPRPRRPARRSCVAVRAAADEQQRGVRHPSPDRRQRPDQHVLALARHQPGHAHDHRPAGQPVPLPDRPRRPRPGGRSRRPPRV